MKKLKNSPQATDNEAWIEAIDGVTKINQPEIPSSSEAPLIINEVKPSIDYHKAYSGAELSKISLDNFDNIDKRTADKLRKGEFKIERRLDLHGLTEKEAFEAVTNFIRNAYMQGLRCLLIITGKGMNRDSDEWYEKKGILRESLPNWLNHPDLRPLILAASQAKIEDGGSGAIYVLLRRQRNRA